MFFSTFDSTFADYEDSFSNPNNKINWSDLIGQWNAIGSQAISAWGKNPTQQVGGNGVFGIGQGYSPAAVNQSQAQIQAAIAQQNQGNMTPAQLAAFKKSVGGGVGSGIDGALQWATENPLLVGGVALGMFLLFRDPPKSRR